MQGHFCRSTPEFYSAGEHRSHGDVTRATRNRLSWWSRKCDSSDERTVSRRPDFGQMV